MGGMVRRNPPHLARHRQADQRLGAVSANISGRKAAADANERRFGGERRENGCPPGGGGEPRAGFRDGAKEGGS